MKKICIRGASTLRAFTDAITGGFRSLGCEVADNLPIFTLCQIHGSPASEKEDLELLVRAADVYLIHRPDEILSRMEIREFFEEHPRKKIILMGDLALSDPFWQDRREFITIIPHPFLDLSLPPQSGRFIMGAYTAWGEMRDFRHFISLAEEVRLLTDKIELVVGGPGLHDVPSFMTLSQELFIPHFNVQLYHLNGRKRLGESSGSLHRGITIPVIFEANGIERVEGLHVVKVDANSELSRIDFKSAAREIVELVHTGFSEKLEHNKAMALKNTPLAFAKKFMELFPAS